MVKIIPNDIIKNNINIKNYIYKNFKYEKDFWNRINDNLMKLNKCTL